MKRILLIEQDDPRRRSRVLLLERAGYEVATADRFEDVEHHSEVRFDLVLIETENIQKASVAYGDRVKVWAPKLPIVMLSDNGLFLPKDSLLARFPEGRPSPLEMLANIASLLLASEHKHEN